MRYNGEINDMDDLTKAAIELDDKLYQRSIEKRGESRFTGRTTWGQGTRGGRDS